jgi:hypothetical protein
VQRDTLIPIRQHGSSPRPADESIPKRRRCRTAPISCQAEHYGKHLTVVFSVVWAAMRSAVALMATEHDVTGLELQVAQVELP